MTYATHAGALVPPTLATLLINSHSTFVICEQAGARYKKILGSFVYFHTQRVVSTSALGNVWTGRRTSRQTTHTQYVGGRRRWFEGCKTYRSVNMCSPKTQKLLEEVEGKEAINSIHQHLTRGNPHWEMLLDPRLRFDGKSLNACSCNCKWEREESSAGNAER